MRLELQSLQCICHRQIVDGALGTHLDDDIGKDRSRWHYSMRWPMPFSANPVEVTVRISVRSHHAEDGVLTYVDFASKRSPACIECSAIRSRRKKGTAKLNPRGRCG